ncbi:hypothetical protein CROQUDRAFT_99761 [Cronartium quercuum f. sp. fusiforme G11]|uniref:Uncharacterized protein n=1 Tax=Cronartium quercuum f. sp. fusiforme G11 TaxID=708437 RepID=A0A9P6T6C3_9BASI|nr:hypothetical protein CROQUDRAFT_99761 [Cronartium quercuum f. sp. fusiforme G11]
MPKDLINKKGMELHPTALSFHEMLAKARDHAGQWDSVLISTVNLTTYKDQRNYMIPL